MYAGDPGPFRGDPGDANEGSIGDRLVAVRWRQWRIYPVEMKKYPNPPAPILTVIRN